MVLFGRSANKRLDLDQSRPASAAAFSLNRKDSTGSFAPSANASSRGLSKKTSASSLFSLSRFGGGSNGGRPSTDASSIQEDALSSDAANVAPKAAKVLGIDNTQQPQSFAQAWLRRGKNLKRHASKLSLSSSIHTVDDEQEQQQQRQQHASHYHSRKNSVSEQASIASSRKVPNISAPSNFQHVTHTRPAHFKKLNVISSQNDLVAEFSALRAGQCSRGELRGIKVDDLHSRSASADISLSTGFPTQSYAFSPRDSVVSPTSPLGISVAEAQISREPEYQDHSDEDPNLTSRIYWDGDSSDSCSEDGDKEAAHPDTVEALFQPPTVSIHVPIGGTWFAPFESVLDPVDEEEDPSEGVGLGLTATEIPSPTLSIPANIISEKRNSTHSTHSIHSNDGSIALRAISPLSFSRPLRNVQSSFAQQHEESIKRHTPDLDSPIFANAQLPVKQEGEPILKASNVTAQEVQTGTTEDVKQSKPAPKVLKSILKQPQRPPPEQPVKLSHRKRATGEKYGGSVSNSRSVTPTQHPRRKLSASSIPKPKAEVAPPRHAKVQAELDSLQQILLRLEAEAAARNKSKLLRRHTADFTAIIGRADFGEKSPVSKTSLHRRQRTTDATISHYATPRSPNGSSGSQTDSYKTHSPSNSASSVETGALPEDSQLPTPPRTPQRPNKRACHERDKSESSAASSASRSSYGNIAYASRIPIATFRRRSSMTFVNDDLEQDSTDYDSLYF